LFASRVSRAFAPFGRFGGAARLSPLCDFGSEDLVRRVVRDGT
jgi:hypothetical protein